MEARSEAIAGLEPAPLWEHFAALSNVPRPSKKEAQVLEYLKGLIGDMGYGFRQDAAGNIVVQKPASTGCEDAPVVILQAHVDMVCEKNAGTEHDFETDPIRLVRDGDWLTADGTTLGADNGIGVAAMLAVLEAKDLRHPPLELLFTVDEETGVTGAKELEPGFLAGSTMLNLDTEEHGAFYVGCAGGIDTAGTLQLVRVDPKDGTIAAELAVRGLKGGHSGCDIHLGRGNAIQELARLLSALMNSCPIQLAHISGGDKINAIPREAHAVFLIKEKDFESALDESDLLIEALPDDMFEREPDLCIDDGYCECDGRPVSVEDTRRIVELLASIPHGVIQMSEDIPGLVQTSTNLAAVTVAGGVLEIRTSQRSSVAAELRDIAHIVEARMTAAGMAVRHGSGYPAWQPDLSSPLLAVAKETYRSLFGDDAQVKAIHAGLECGIIREKFPEMDMISLGPTIESAHSPGERVNIPSAGEFWQLLAGLLDRLAGDHN